MITPDTPAWLRRGSSDKGGSRPFLAPHSSERGGYSCALERRRCRSPAAVLDSEVGTPENGTRKLPETLDLPLQDSGVNSAADLPPGFQLKMDF